MLKKQSKADEYLHFFFACMTISSILICGCTHCFEGFLARSTFKEANDYFGRGNYKNALSKYEQIIEKYPAEKDKVLFEMGIIYAYPSNEQKDYQKSLECFEKLITDCPESGYRQDSEVMIFHINKFKSIISQQKKIDALEQEVKNKEKDIISQQKKIDALEQEVKNKEKDIISQQKKIDALEQEVNIKIFAIQNRSADKILIEKKERRLTLISKDKVLKTYNIALGGNPNGQKEREGDNKTPEGIYFIDSRNKNSRYHRSLHISYPNKKDKKRAKELGVSPGGNILIHGIKNGYSWVGDAHSAFDWTQGCIAVTDEEIEEIEKLVPNGTIVEIRQ